MRPRHRLLRVLVVATLAPWGTVVTVASSALAAKTAKRVYEIAYVGDVSTSTNPIALNVENGARLAVNHANAMPNLPFRLRFVAYNTKGDLTTQSTVLKQLVASKGVLAVIGPSNAIDAVAAGTILSAAKLAMVTPSVTTPSLATSGFSDFFRDVPDDAVQGAADANFLVRSMSSSRLFVVSDASPYGDEITSALTNQATANHASVISQSAPVTTGCGGTANSSEYASVALAAVASQATSLFYGGYNCDFGLLLGALNNVGFHGVVLSSDGADASTLLSATSSSSAADGVYLSCGCSISANASFNMAFTAMAHVNAANASYAVESFDATNAVIAALRTLKVVTRTALIAALHHLVFHGAARTIRFQANGNLVSTRVFISQVQGHKVVALGFS